VGRPDELRDLGEGESGVLQQVHRAGAAVPRLTLAAGAGGQRGMSFGRCPGSWSVVVGGMVPSAAAALRAVGLSLWRGPGASSRRARAALPSTCALCAPRRSSARSGRAAEASRADQRRGGAPVGSARVVVAWTVGSGWQSQRPVIASGPSLGTVAVLIADGLRELILATV
jgi:hypothetical protein